MRNIFHILLFVLFSTKCFARLDNYVKNQAEFEQAMKKVNAGHPMSIELAQGTFVLTRSVTAKSSLTLKGNQSVIRGAQDEYGIGDAIKKKDGYYVCKLKHPIGTFGLFMNGHGQLLHISESVDVATLVNKTTEKIIGAYAAKDSIEIKIPITANLKRLSDKTFQRGYGYFDCGWSRVNFRVLKSDKDYFYCTTLDHNNVTDYNHDLTRYKKPIRYVLYNVEKDNKGIYYDDQFIYIPQNVKRIYYLNDYKKKGKGIKTLSDFTATGITFDHIGTVFVQQKKDCTFKMEDCSFLHTLGCALKIDRKDKKTATVAIVKNCNFNECALLYDNPVYLQAILTGKNSITMSGCTISRYPDADLIYKNTAAGISASGDITISNNLIYNTPRDHVKLRYGRILCSDNVIYNTNAFNAKTDRNLGSDYGLIYCGNVFFKTPGKELTNKESIITLYGNLLYGCYAYDGKARGVFIDDGRGDVTCTHNLIYDTQKYSIDSRSAKNFKGISSIRVKIEENLLGWPYRLKTNLNVIGQNSPVSSGNILLYNTDNSVKNIRKLANDTRIFGITLSNTTDMKKVKVSKTNFTKLSKTPIWNNIKKYVFCK